MRPTKTFAGCSTGSIIPPFTVLLLALLFGLARARAADEMPAMPQTPLPLVPGAKVVTLWPPGSPTLKNVDQKETFIYDPTNTSHIKAVKNVNNPSIELHLAPADKANGTAIILAPGGGNIELTVRGIQKGAAWLNSIGCSVFVLRYRLRPTYSSSVEALADTQRAVRTVRANAKEWNVDPTKIGVMGSSAGGEQASRIALKYDAGNQDAADAVGRVSCRPDFVVLVYAGVRPELDLKAVPKDAPPAFLTTAGLGDAKHARMAMAFYTAWLDAKIPAELHIYGSGHHGKGITPSDDIPFGTWSLRFVDWAVDLGMMKR